MHVLIAYNRRIHLRSYTKKPKFLTNDKIIIENKTMKNTWRSIRGLRVSWIGWRRSVSRICRSWIRRISWVRRVRSSLIITLIRIVPEHTVVRQGRVVSHSSTITPIWIEWHWSSITGIGALSHWKKWKYKEQCKVCSYWLQKPSPFQLYMRMHQHNMYLYNDELQSRSNFRKRIWETTTWIYTITCILTSINLISSKFRSKLILQWSIRNTFR